MMLNLPSMSLQRSVSLVLLIITLGTFVQSQGYTCDQSLKGFATLGAGTTGGGDARPLTVTNIDDLRKACGGNEPAVIKVCGTIQTGPGAIRVGSNKSIIGVDGATIQGGLSLANGTSNVIIRNLKIVGSGFQARPPDAIALRGSNNVWIDHCDLSDAGDGLLDITKGSDLVTVSWNKFSYTELRFNRNVSLVGASADDGALDRGKLRVTYLGNHFAHNATEGMARVTFGQNHFANNFYNAPGNNYAIGAGRESQLLIENNMFLNMKDPIIALEDSDPAAFVTETGNIYKDTVGLKVTGAIGRGATPFTRAPYALNLVPATEVENLVCTCAGVKAS